MALSPDWGGGVNPWKSLADYPRARRGFDDDRAWLPHFSVPHGVLVRAVLAEDVRGSLAAIAEFAGWWAHMMPCDPADRERRELLVAVAKELESMAAALRSALC